MIDTCPYCDKQTWIGRATQGETTIELPALSELAAWGESEAPDAPMGIPRVACECPLSRFMRRRYPQRTFHVRRDHLSTGEEIMDLPSELCDVVSLVDHTFELGPHNEITAQSFLAILERVQDAKKTEEKEGGEKDER